MIDKITSIRLKASTKYNFNCAKVENKFRSADDFLIFLLGFYAKSTSKPLENQMENRKVYKRQKTIKSNNNKKDG